MRFKRTKPGEYENAETGLRLSRTIRNGWAAWSPANESRERIQIVWGQSTMDAAKAQAEAWWHTVGSKEDAQDRTVNMPTTPEYRVLDVGEVVCREPGTHLVRQGSGTGIAWRTMCGTSYPVATSIRTKPLDLSLVGCLGCLDVYTEETRPGGEPLPAWYAVGRLGNRYAGIKP